MGAQRASGRRRRLSLAPGTPEAAAQRRQLVAGGPARGGWAAKERSGALHTSRRPYGRGQQGRRGGGGDTGGRGSIRTGGHGWAPRKGPGRNVEVKTCTCSSPRVAWRVALCDALDAARAEDRTRHHSLAGWRRAVPARVSRRSSPSSARKGGTTDPTDCGSRWEGIYQVRLSGAPPAPGGLEPGADGPLPAGRAGRRPAPPRPAPPARVEGPPARRQFSASRASARSSMAPRRPRARCNWRKTCWRGKRAPVRRYSGRPGSCAAAPRAGRSALARLRAWRSPAPRGRWPGAPAARTGCGRGWADRASVAQEGAQGLVGDVRSSCCCHSMVRWVTTKVVASPGGQGTASDTSPPSARPGGVCTRS